MYLERGNLVGVTGNIPLAPGGHQKFKERYEGGKQAIPAYGPGAPNRSDLSHIPEHELAGSWLIAIQKKSMLAYCEQNRIALIENKDGSHSLKGRENIVIKDNRWRNTKMVHGSGPRTTGGIIEFVANVRRTNEIHAIAELTGNRRFLLLDKYLSQESRNYQAFHLPKQELPLKGAMFALESLAKSLGKPTIFSEALIKSRRVRVATENTIYVLFGEDSKGAVKYQKGKDGNWLRSVSGKLRGGVFFQKGLGENLKVFDDPFSFMQATKGKGLMGLSSASSVLVLDSDSKESLDFVLAENPRLKTIEFASGSSKSLGAERMNLFRELGISVKETDILSLEKSKGIVTGKDRKSVV